MTRRDQAPAGCCGVSPRRVHARRRHRPEQRARLVRSRAWVDARQGGAPPSVRGCTVSRARSRGDAMRRITHKAAWDLGRTWCNLDLGPSGEPVPSAITLRQYIEHVTCNDCKTNYAAAHLAASPPLEGADL